MHRASKDPSPPRVNAPQCYTSHHYVGNEGSYRTEPSGAQCKRTSYHKKDQNANHMKHWITLITATALADPAHTRKTHTTKPFWLEGLFLTTSLGRCTVLANAMFAECSDLMLPPVDVPIITLHQHQHAKQRPIGLYVICKGLTFCNYYYVICKSC